MINQPRKEDIDQILVLKFLDLVKKRFGVYLDSIWGYVLIRNSLENNQGEASKKTGLTIEQLDQNNFIRGKGPPTTGKEIHRTTQGEFKKNNMPGGLNYRTALSDCIVAFFNDWTTFKRDVLKKKGMDDKQISFLKYLKEIRDRITHTDKESQKRPINSIKLKYTDYVLPAFEAFQAITLSEEDLEAIVEELRESIADEYLL
jgi:hypothetical protein